MAEPVARRPSGGSSGQTIAPVFASAQMREVLRLAERAAKGDAKVLITGETGVGKDVIAGHVHRASARRNAEYLAVNCAGLTESLLESELFGHVKGSFTGALRDKPGKLVLANRGTLFLDEVGEMSLRMQGLLLRFLENGEIQAVGSDAVRQVDVRIIAATNRTLPEMVRSGHFREDLLYRLQVIHIHVPPLRERRADIRPLAMHFIGASDRKVSLTEEAWTVIEAYRWPGNVRQLQNVIEQIVWRSNDSEPIDASQLPPNLTAGGSAFLPTRERRRQLADDLYQALVEGGYSFWDHVHPLFMNRDITRHDIRQLVERGLCATTGNYRALLELFRMPQEDYKRFMNFLATHDCRAEFRDFRNGSSRAAAPLPPIVRRLPSLPQPQVPREQVDAHPSPTKVAS
jgi:transcriptional regulator with GAF, ATPase, and Fis domain